MSILLSVLLAATLVEPTVNADGTALDDLADCTVTVTDQVGRTGSTTFAAASPTGGGQHIFDPLTVLPAAEGSSQVVAICTDLGGAVSAASNALTPTFPALPPGPPALAP